MTIGLDCKLYRNTGVYASPTWSPILSVRDLTVPMSIKKVDTSSRVAAISQFKPGHVEYSLTFSMVREDDTANYAALKTAAAGRSSVDIAVADGPIATTGTIYVRMQMSLFKFDEKQPIQDPLEADIELAPNDAVTHPPAYTTV